jgi:hypothetical protein
VRGREELANGYDKTTGGGVVGGGCGGSWVLIPPSFGVQRGRSEPETTMIHGDGAA